MTLPVGQGLPVPVGARTVLARVAGILEDAEAALHISACEVQVLNAQYLQLTGAMDREAWAREGPSENRVRLAPDFDAISRRLSLLAAP